MRIEFYKNKEDRLKKIKTAKSKKETVMHDDFMDKDNKSTNGNSGKLTFEKRVDSIDTVFAKQKALVVKLKDDSITFAEFKELFRLGLP